MDSRSTKTRAAPGTAPAGDVVERLPYGVVVVEPGGLVSTANPCAQGYLPDLAAGTATRCGELLDCMAPGGPCVDGCLAERAASSEAALPEIRIDTRRGGSVSALWVTAAPLGEGRALLHLRPGDARDRRRRSDPHWISGPRLRISSFGRMHVDSPEGPLSGKWLQQRPGHVLKYLVCERNRVVHAEEIAEALWPGAGPTALNNVRHFIHSLRDKLEPDRPKRAPSSFIVAVQGGYAIDRRRVAVDADDFEEAARKGIDAARRGALPEAEAELRKALELYRGDFLSDEPYAEWAYAERDRLRGLTTQCLRLLATILAKGEDIDGAAAVLEQLAELEPYDAEVHRQLLTAWLRLGRRTEAARRFTSFRMRMLREFGEEPDFELADLTQTAARARSL
ncbi:MAG TPA: BTAD domain-containing putative transcriptional regulator [Thermoleophilaceae bacterium]|nr:BTAD domain-containing putative transcriptional regulator [Thermoleophilaceae bacterium]